MTEPATAARSIDAANLEAIAADVAERAAALVRTQVGKAHQVGTKSSHSDVVTSTDLAVEDFIQRELLAATPAASIVGEEGTAVAGTTRVGWLIDPIDGTVNFLYDLPVVAISIAATVDGAVAAGAVADVVRGEVFSASRGGGTRRDGQAVVASDVAELRDALIGTGFSYSAATRSAQARAVSRLIPAARDIRCFGSAALHLAWVACGRLDGYWEGETQPWDVAAGALLATEAGATVATAAPGGTGPVIAAPPRLFDELRAILEA